MLMAERKLRRVIRKLILEAADGFDPFSLGFPTMKPGTDPTEYFDSHEKALKKAAQGYKQQEYDLLSGVTGKPDESPEEYIKRAEEEGGIKDGKKQVQAYQKLADVVLGDPSDQEKAAALKAFALGANPLAALDGETTKPDGKPYEGDPLLGPTNKPSSDPSSDGDLESRVSKLEDVIKKFEEKIK